MNFESFRRWMESRAGWTSFLPHGRQRQRTFPFSREPEWNRKPDSYAGLDSDPDEQYQMDNLYHVTTNLAGVISSRMLLPRSMVSNYGLGGNTSYYSYSDISTTHSYDHASNIYSQIKYVSEIARGRVLPSQIVGHFYSVLYEDDLFDVAKDALPPGTLGEDPGWQDVMDRLDRSMTSAKERYEFFQEMEEKAVSRHTDSDDYGPSPVVGFVAPYENVVKIDPDQVAIVQVVARKGARAVPLPQEQEIRFSPEDLKIVRYIRPS